MREEGGQTVLVMDDDVDLLKMLSRRLRHWNYRVLSASSGEEGLGLAEQWQPDLILLDILMPRMKGREVCARLKASQRTQAIPVIFLTALGMPEHVKAGMDLGAEDYIIKPFDAQELRERIWVCLLRRKRPARTGSFAGGLRLGA